MIYAIGYDDLGRRTVTLHEQPGGALTMHQFTPGADKPVLLNMPNLREAIREMKRCGATLIVASPCDVAVDFMKQFAAALSEQ